VGFGLRPECLSGCPYVKQEGEFPKTFFSLAATSLWDACWLVLGVGPGGALGGRRCVGCSENSALMTDGYLN